MKNLLILGEEIYYSYKDNLNISKNYAGIFENKTHVSQRENTVWDQGRSKVFLDKTASLAISQNLKSAALFSSSFAWILSISNVLTYLLVCLDSE